MTPSSMWQLSTSPYSLSASIRRALQALDVCQPHIRQMFHFFPTPLSVCPRQKMPLIQRTCVPIQECLLSELARTWRPSHSTTTRKDTVAFRLPCCNVPSIAVAVRSDVPTPSAEHEQAHLIPGR